MINRIMQILGHKSITYLILLGFINFFISHQYFFYVTDFFNNSTILHDGSFGSEILTSIYGFLIGTYLFLYITLFIFIANKIEIKGRQAFIIGSLNLYLFIFIALYVLYIFLDISILVIQIYYLLLPLISLGLLIFNNTNGESINKINNQEGFQSSENLMDKILNDHEVGNVNNFNNNKDQVLNKFDFNQKQDKVSTTEGIGTSIKGFFANLLKGDEDESNTSINNLDFLDLEKDKNKDNLDFNNLDYLDDIENNSNKSKKNDFDIDELIDGDNHNQIEDIIINIDNDKIELDDDNFYKLDENEEDYLDDITDIQSIENSNLSNTESNNTNNKVNKVELNDIYVKGFEHKVQDLELVSNIIAEL